jgi:hypothetical protein
VENFKPKPIIDLLTAIFDKKIWFVQKIITFATINNQTHTINTEFVSG